MPITSISQEPETAIKEQAPIREVMDVYLPDIPDGISRRNGMIYVLTGSGGSGKTSLLLSQFKKGGAYRKKFHNLYYFVPSASFASVDKHPFKNHERVFHELTADGLYELHDTLMELKEKNTEEEKSVEYNCVIIDDFASSLKDKEIVRALNKLLIKARHINTSFIFTLQSIMYFPKTLRRQITYATIFRPRNSEEWSVINTELLQMKDIDAKKVFEFVFDAPYTHLDLDLFDNKIYKNFHLLTIENSDDL